MKRKSNTLKKQKTSTTNKKEEVKDKKEEVKHLLFIRLILLSIIILGT